MPIQKNKDLKAAIGMRSLQKRNLVLVRVQRPEAQRQRSKIRKPTLCIRISPASYRTRVWLARRTTVKAGLEMVDLDKIGEFGGLTVLEETASTQRSVLYRVTTFSSGKTGESRLNVPTEDDPNWPFLWMLTMPWNGASLDRTTACYGS
jgi:hypothetical protein